jgi:hypothetical protein
MQFARYLRQIPANQEYPASGEEEPKPLPIFLSVSVTVICDRYFTLLLRRSKAFIGKLQPSP